MYQNEFHENEWQRVCDNHGVPFQVTGKKSGLYYPDIKVGELTFHGHPFACGHAMMGGNSMIYKSNLESMVACFTELLPLFWKWGVGCISGITGAATFDSAYGRIQKDFLERMNFEVIRTPNYHHNRDGKELQGFVYLIVPNPNESPSSRG